MRRETIFSALLTCESMVALSVCSFPCLFTFRHAGLFGALRSWVTAPVDLASTDPTWVGVEKRQ